MPRRIERRSDAKRMRPGRSGHDGLKTHDGTTADRPPFDRLKVNILCDGSLIRRPLPRLLTLALFHTVDRLVYQNGDSLPNSAFYRILSGCAFTTFSPNMSRAVPVNHLRLTPSLAIASSSFLTRLSKGLSPFLIDHAQTPGPPLSRDSFVASFV